MAFIAKKAKKQQQSRKALVTELEDLFLRGGTEMSERGFYHRVLPVLSSLGGSIDKNTEQLARIKEVILELKKVV